LTDISSFKDGNYVLAVGSILSGLLGLAVIVLPGETVWVVTVLTPSGSIKLFLPRPFWELDTELLFPDWLDRLKSDVSHDLGPKVSEVLILRKGQPDSHKNHDLKFSCIHDSEGVAPPFFQIDGDCIHVLDYDYDKKPVIKDTARLDGLVAAEKSRKHWEYGKFSSVSASRRNEVILRFDTGDTTTHYLLRNFEYGLAIDEDPADELVKALEKYIKSHSSGS
jgi:hypothetical protein